MSDRAWLGAPEHPCRHDDGTYTHSPAAGFCADCGTTVEGDDA